MTGPNARPWHSLRWRLPVLFTSLIALILGSFLWITNRTLEQVLIRTGSDRAQSVADQVAAFMVQGVVRGTTEARRVATDPAIAAVLRDRSPEHIDAARKLLISLAAPAQPPVELWDARGGRILQVEPPARPVSTTATPAPAVHAYAVPPPQATGLTPFRLDSGVVVYELIADVADQGYVVVPRALATPQTTDAIRRLVGSGATVAIGNQHGDIWSDFGRAIPGPSLEASNRGVRPYQTPAGEERLGAISLIPNSPWAIWIDFPRALMLAPARTMLRRMLWLAVIVIAAAAMIVAFVSARITGPLHQLMSASEAIAASRFDARVPATRRDEIGRLGAAFNTMTDRVAASQHDLERRVDARTSELQEAVRELEAFSYSVSHDLRAPLRHVAGFATLLDRSSGAALGEEGRRHIKTIAGAAERMGRLIDDLLAFSRVSRTPLTKRRIDLNLIVQEAQHEVESDTNAVAWQIHQLPLVDADPALLRLALVNLLSNAIKYSSKHASPVVEIGVHQNGNDEVVVFVRDNGEGFDMKYAHKLFGVFQRLHSREEFEGTGIGLANVRRIVQRHGGRTWAEGVLKQGATFYFSLPGGGTIDAN